MTDETGPQLAEPLARERSFARHDAKRLVLAALLILASATAGIVLDLVPSAATYSVGQIAPSGGIKATKTMPIANQVETDQARQRARDGVPEVYDYTQLRASSVAQEQVTLLKDEIGPVDDAMDPAVAPEARKIALQSAVAALPTDARAPLLSLSPDRWEPVRTAAIQILSSAEVPELRDADLAGRRTAVAEQYMPAGLSVDEQKLVISLVSPLLVANSFPSDSLTQGARDQAAAAVAPIIDNVIAGQVIVDGGHPITEADMVKIRALGLETPQVKYGRLAGWLALNVLVAILLLLWLWRFRAVYWHRTRTLLLICLIVAVAVLAVKLPGSRSTLPYFVPAAAAAMLLTVLLDSTVAMVAAALIALVAGIASGSSLELAMYVLLGSFAGSLTIGKGDRLHYFIQAAFAMTVTQAIVIAIFYMLGSLDVPGLVQLWGAAAASSVLAAIVTLGSFAVLGNIFGILTGWQLLELANPSQPLLRRLLLETPGTYHHALMVGNLGERAAAAIGADPLLTRVAAYYHDIGKLGNPAAFIENQAGGENIHDTLDPEDSAAILKQHVPDGIELAYRAKIPKPLIAFIPQHHGTALLSYFYAKEREAVAAPLGGLETAAGAAAAGAVDQRRFRHAGPKPQTKEAAILMLADGVEASVRSLASRDEASIRAMVGRIIDERLKDGQLDECELTIHDLESVREAFIQQLLGMYHQRIEYPQNKIVELESRRERGLA